MKQLIKSTYVLIVILLISSCTENASDIGESSISNIDTVLLNVKYGNHPRQIMDIHLPADRDSSTPVIMIIHGGAWKAGQKEDMNMVVQLIKKYWSNVAIANINYRYASLKDGVHHQEMMSDIASAFAHLKNNRSRYAISEKYAMSCASAGGHLAMIYAYSMTNNIRCIGNIFGPSNLRDWDWYSSFNVFLGSKVGDILTEYVGKSWDTTAYATVSPITYIQSKTPPTITFHGSLDPIVPMYQSRYLHGKLQSLNVKNELHEYPAFHSFDAGQSEDVINKMITFMKINMELQ
jgi:acetyl esterase/lipase